MSFTSSIFTSLINAYPTWSVLKDFLVSDAGGKLSVYEIHGTNKAMIRYVKEQSNMGIAGVGAFRSVVWDMDANRPISVTAFKSAKGEGLPAFTPESAIVMEEFVDGVLIGQFWDAATESWRIHTRSMMDAECRYFGDRSFSELFNEAVQATYGTYVAALGDRLEKDVTYSWILQHAENRIVCPVQKPRVVLVSAYRVGTDGSVTIAATPEGIVTPRQYFNKGVDAAVGRMDITPVLEVIGIANRTDHDQEGSDHTAVSGMVPVDMPGVISMIASMRGSVRYQGVVIKTASEPFGRWKIRTQVYNYVRKMRGNTARRDFLWMDLWSKGGLDEYLKYFPEERLLTTELVNRWKSVTKSVYRIYVDAFKARTMDRTQIPAKFRPLVYGLHNLYMTSLKPTNRTLDWSQCVHWMNDRDTAQKVFVLNWDKRQERTGTNTNTNANTFLPLEPQATAPFRPAASEIEEGEVVTV